MDELEREIYNKCYYMNNKERILLLMKSYVQCTHCGRKAQFRNLYRHMKRPICYNNKKEIIIEFI